MQRVRLIFGDQYLTYIWNPDLVPIITDASSVQHPQRLFHKKWSVPKNHATFFKKSVACVHFK